MSSASPSGRIHQKQRTRRQILAAAAELIAAGDQPTVTEAADAAGISRRTAYRYFPNQAKLLAEAALESLRPLMEAAIDAAPGGASDADIEMRVITLVRALQKLTLKHEALLRTMIHATVLETGRAAPRRGTRRVEWVERAVAPLRGQLPRAVYRRLVSALSLCVGTEAMLVFRDIRGLGPAQAVASCEWLALAALRSALDEGRRR